MIRRPPRATRTDTLIPYTTLFLSLLPPVASAPCFSIRKPAARIHRLLDYVADGIMRAEVALELSMAVVERKNVLRSEEHTSELQSLMRISYAVFCLKKKAHGRCHGNSTCTDIYDH